MFSSPSLGIVFSTARARRPARSKRPHDRIGDLAVAGDDDLSRDRGCGHHLGISQHALALTAVRAAAEQHDIRRTGRQRLGIRRPQVPAQRQLDPPPCVQRRASRRLSRQITHEADGGDPQPAAGARSGSSRADSDMRARGLDGLGESSVEAIHNVVRHGSRRLGAPPPEHPEVTSTSVTFVYVLPKSARTATVRVWTLLRRPALQLRLTPLSPSHGHASSGRPRGRGPPATAAHRSAPPRSAGCPAAG